MIHQILDDGNITQIAGDHQRRNAIVVLPVHVLSQFHQQLYHLQSLAHRPLLVKAHDETETRSGGQGGFMFIRHDGRLGSVFQQQFHQLKIAGERCAHQGCGKHDARRAATHACLRSVIDHHIGIGMCIQQLLDERQRVIGNGPRKVGSRFHVATVHCPEQRRKTTRISLVNPGAAIDQKSGHIVMAIEHSHAQRVLAITGNRVDIGTASDKYARGFQQAFAGSKDKGREFPGGTLDRTHFFRSAAPHWRTFEATPGIRGDEVCRQVYICTAFQQHADNLVVTFVHCPHQGSGATPGFTCVDVGAGIKQHIHCCRNAGARRNHQRGIA